jgi:hypothetical protein
LLKVFALLGNADVTMLNTPDKLFGALANAPFDKVQDILDEMLYNISRMHDGNIETQLTPENVDSFVEDFTTLLKLRGEALKINNFFQRAGEINFGNSKDAAVVIKRQG